MSNSSDIQTLRSWTSKSKILLQYR